MEFKHVYPALQDEDCMMKLTDHVTTGGSVTELAKLWEVPYRVLIRFLRGDPIRSRQYDEALADRKEWVVERLLTELRSISCVAMTQVIDKDGALLPTDSWPDDVKSNLKKMVVVETFEGAGEDRTWTGYLKTIEFHDKLKAIDMYGKQLKMWSDDKTIKVGMTYEELLTASRSIDKNE
jgi:hypothetical protein